MNTYEDQIFKIPIESEDYADCSNFVVGQIESIIHRAIANKQNQIVINTNLRLGLPMENINKIAGPFVEAWACERFLDVLEDDDNIYQLVNVESQERLSKADVILQFRKDRKTSTSVTAEVDVKATSQDIASSGKSPNITSFARIRTAYVIEPDYIFVILSLKHRVYSLRDDQTKLMNGIMEVVAYNAYDLKFISLPDLCINPALGTGQIQIRDIHYVNTHFRTTWEFCQLLDKKYLSSSKRTFQDWSKLATQYGWIK